MANKRTYLAGVVAEMMKLWPDNRTVNLVCHGHSVPSGYAATPRVDPLNSYPHLLRAALAERFPFSVVNVIVTAIGGECSEAGAARFVRDVLCHQPDVVMIDYALNDRGLGLPRAEAAWRAMIEATLAQGVKLLLLTPTADVTGLEDPQAADWLALQQHAQQVRDLASEYEVGLVDSFAAFQAYVQAGGDLTDLLGWQNHPNRQGHELVMREALRWFAKFI